MSQFGHFLFGPLFSSLSRPYADSLFSSPTNSSSATVRPPVLHMDNFTPFLIFAMITVVFILYFVMHICIGFVRKNNISYFVLFLFEKNLCCVLEKNNIYIYIYIYIKT